MTINKNDITAVIIAGGKGSRLGGQDKGLLEINGKPMIEHILQRIKPQARHIVINANRNTARYGRYGYPVIKDSLDNFQGPLAGFSAAMNRVTSKYIVTLPCDNPQPADDLVARFIAASNTAAKNSNGLVVAHDGYRLQPVYALIPLSLHLNLKHFLEGNGRQIRQWYATMSYNIADFSDKPETFININTEQQHQELEKHEQQ